MITSMAIAIGIFLALLAAMELGRWIRRRRPDAADVGGENAPADGVVFAVLGLIVAFTFSSAASRFDELSRLIVSQSNTTGTLWSRIDLLKEPDREPMRGYLRDWVKGALEAQPSSADMEPAAFEARFAKEQQLQNDAWHYAVAAVGRVPNPQVTPLVLSPLNEWMDLSTTRTELSHRGIPPMVLPTLVLLSILGAVLAGFSMAKHRMRSVLHMLAFAGSMSCCLYVIMDLEHPRSGLIRIDAADHAMQTLYASMTAPQTTSATQSEK